MGRPLSDYIKNTIDNRGKNPKNYYDMGKYPVIDNVLIKNTLYPDMSAVNRYIDQDTFDNFLRGYVHKNMPLITLVGNGIGNVTLAPSSDVAIIQNTIGFEVEDTLDEVFLYYLLLYKQEQVKIFNRGSGQPSVKKTDLLKMDVDIPSLEIQKQIVSILMAVDNKIETNKAINRNLSEQLKLLFEDMFITKADDTWADKKLGDFLDLERGLSYKGKFLSEDEGVPMLNLGNILPNSVFRPEKLKFYTGEFKQRNVVKPGDIVVANTDLTQAREVLGSAIRVPNLGYDTVICSHHISIVRNCTLSNNFILGLLNMPAYRTRVAGFATGTTVLALPNDTILNCEFKCPPDELLKMFDEISEPIYMKMEEIRLENDKLAEIRDNLLPKLMAGEIDVTELEYE